MGDLISRQAAIEACLKFNGVGWVWSQILDEIEKMPSVDAVEVVRCKDCYHYDEESEKCILNNSEMKPIDYYSYGSK